MVAFAIVALVMWLTDRNEQEASTVVPPALLVDRRAEIAEAHSLSPRETEVFMLLAQGRSRAYISEELVVSEGTIKTHISHIYAKLGIHGRQEMFDLLLAEEKHADKNIQNTWRLWINGASIVSIKSAPIPQGRRGGQGET